jgi:hypothetical protein
MAVAPMTVDTDVHTDVANMGTNPNTIAASMGADTSAGIANMSADSNANAFSAGRTCTQQGQCKNRSE